MSKMLLETKDMIFVFGSNESGIHGAGAAAFAHKAKGAVYGVGWGKQGQSFAIPTKDWRIDFMDLRHINHYVDRFMVYAAQKGNENFQVTQIGCGLGGWKPKDIAPLFLGSPSNCYFDTEWEPYLEKGAKFWGSFS